MLFRVKNLEKFVLDILLFNRSVKVQEDCLAFSITAGTKTVRVALSSTLKEQLLSQECQIHCFFLLVPRVQIYGHMVLPGPRKMKNLPTACYFSQIHYFILRYVFSKLVKVIKLVMNRLLFSKGLIIQGGHKFLFLALAIFCARHFENVSGGIGSRASYQIRKITGCACTGNAGNVSPRRRFQMKPLISDPGMHHGTCRDTCRDRLPAVTGKTFPAFPAHAPPRFGKRPM